MTHWFCETWVLLEELDDAVGELRVVDAQRLHFVQRQQDFQQEHFVLFFQW